MKHKKMSCKLFVPLAYFSIMELFQASQYMAIYSELFTLNHVTTMLSYIHICFQPLFLNIFQTAYSNTNAHYYHRIVYPLCIIAGFGMLLRLKGYNYYYDELYKKSLQIYTNETCLCTNYFDHFESNYTLAFIDNISHHVGWNISLYKPTYFTYSLNMHGFLTFVLPFVIERSITVPTAIYIIGIIIGTYSSSNINVQPAMWCYVHVPLMIASLCYYWYNKTKK